MNPAYIILIGAVIVAVGGFIVAVGGFLQSWRQSTFNSQMQAKNEEIGDLNKKIFGLQETTINNITGADNIPQIWSKVFDNGDGIVLRHIIFNRGLYTLYDVNATFIFYVGKQNVKTQDGNDISIPTPMVEIVNIGNVSTKDFRPIGRDIYLPIKNIDCDITISARNGAWSEGLRMQRIEGAWAQATRISEMSTGKVVYEDVSPNYPRGQNGEINWNSR